MIAVHRENAVPHRAPLGRPTEVRGRHEHRQVGPEVRFHTQQIEQLAIVLLGA
ncbi:hypothetical protein OG426_29005 [Streptomyces canus]|uniref:hypothetical protein n=1 Tax=Streptomyces canus TaxID=58343 RepID=UPI00386F1A3A|nr:hypothetical protein OG426_29005 [Streptomyces canus]